jgi:hypothetical protein
MLGQYSLSCWSVLVRGGQYRWCSDRVSGWSKKKKKKKNDLCVDIHLLLWPDGYRVLLVSYGYPTDVFGVWRSAENVMVTLAAEYSPFILWRWVDSLCSCSRLTFGDALPTSGKTTFFRRRLYSCWVPLLRVHCSMLFSVTVDITALFSLFCVCFLHHSVVK